MLPEKHMPLWDEKRFQTPQAKAWEEAVKNKDYKALKPWRKGPFQLGETHIDGEWRCDLKWHRLLPILPDMTNKIILDIGCNNGYFMFEIAKHAPKKVIGIDPSAIYRYQFKAIQNEYKAENIEFIPVGFEKIPELNTTFDIIFCMGILYHHPNPIDILKICKNALNPGGTLIIETLVANHTFEPKPTYAKMKNVFCIPTIKTLETWIQNAGFDAPICHNQTQTTPEEQRVTEWSSSQSLINFLDENDPTKTCEGYPSPTRAIVTTHVPNQSTNNPGQRTINR
jgi:tRNA (mo5U34)-methyltransferase